MSEEESKLVQELRAEIESLRADLARRPAQQEEMEQFAYVASHDLKEPLRIVANYLGLLRRRHGASLDTSAQEYLDIALDTTGRMRQLIDNLLGFSLVQAVVLERQNLAASAEVALKNLAELIAEHQAHVTVASLPELNIDKLQIARLLQNLIANALKYRSERSPQVQISAVEESDCWRINVQDNGMGIADKHQQKIFQMFSRLHGGDQIDGSGIGLATCRRIVERHQGSIGVESVEGEGSCFYFRLPKLGAAS